MKRLFQTNRPRDAKVVAFALGVLFFVVNVGLVAAAPRKRPRRVPVPVATVEPTPEAPVSTESLDVANEAFSVGTAAYQRRQYVPAARAFETAARLDDRDGESLVMAGLAHERAGQPAEARRAFAEALRRPLSDDDRVLAERSLASSGNVTASLAPSTEGQSPWWGLANGTAGGGYDSNIAHLAGTGVRELDRDDVLAGAGGFFASASLLLGGGRTFGNGVSSDLLYAFFQTAFLDLNFDDFGGQDHSLEWSTRFPLSDRLLLTVSPRGEMAFTGVRERFAPFQALVGGKISLAFLESEAARTSLSMFAGARRTLDPEYEFLSGRRLEAELRQSIGFLGLSADLGLRIRRDDLGERRGDAGEMSSTDVRCARCAVTSVSPYSYQAAILAARLATPSGHRVRASLRGRLENRPYLEPIHLETRFGGGRVESWQAWTRRDQRLSWGGDLSLVVAKHVELSARYDFLANRSNVDASAAGRCLESLNPCHPLAYQNRNFNKHVVSLELGALWD